MRAMRLGESVIRLFFAKLSINYYVIDYVFFRWISINFADGTVVSLSCNV